MKIEIDDNTFWATSVIAVCVFLSIVSLLVYKYNITPFEKGYTQKQLNSSTMTAWVKE